MNTTAGPRQAGSLKDRQESLRKELKTTDAGKSAARLFAFTIDANTAQVVKFEPLDASGARCELTDDERSAAASGGLEQALEQAFEAGIGCVLGSEDKDEEGDESQDGELRHLLLAPLLEHSPARRLLQREVLNRAILGTLINHSMKPSAAAGTSAPAEAEAERTGANRSN
jgi:hypothetical protein